jgi:hypothetical protein
LQLERAPNQRVKNIWEKHRGRLLLALVAAVYVNGPAQQKANALNITDNALPRYTLYAVIRRLMRRPLLLRNKNLVGLFA